MRLKPLAELLNISESTLWRIRNNKSYDFPSPILISTVKIWKLLEVEEWLIKNEENKYGVNKYE